MSLETVLVDELRDLYSAESQLVKALPKMAKGSSTPGLKELFESHLEQTKEHVERLKHVFDQLGKKPTGEMCKGMEGLVKEGQEQLESDEEGATKDICIAGAALRVEHYEIAGYTAAIAIARSLGKDEIVALLEETLQEEEEAGEKVLQQTQPLIEEASNGDAELMDEDSGMEDEESDETAPARRAAGMGKHPTKRASR